MCVVASRSMFPKSQLERAANEQETEKSPKCSKFSSSYAFPVFNQ